MCCNLFLLYHTCTTCWSYVLTRCTNRTGWQSKRFSWYSIFVAFLEKLWRFSLSSFSSALPASSVWDHNILVSALFSTTSTYFPSLGRGAELHGVLRCRHYSLQSVHRVSVLVYCVCKLLGKLSKIKKLHYWPGASFFWICTVPKNVLVRLTELVGHCSTQRANTTCAFELNMWKAES